MDNLYWTSEGQRHYLNLETIRLLCFELLCIFEASKPLVEEAEAIELEEGKETKLSDLTLLKLHQHLPLRSARKRYYSSLCWFEPTMIR